VTPFCRAVVDLLKKDRNGSLDAYALREALMAQGVGKHPAAVAMHLTKLAWKDEYVATYLCNGIRVFVLTAKGKTA